MTTKKKPATTIETAKAPAKAAPAPKTTTGKAAPTAAATHKAPARKAAAPKAKAAAAPKSAFDAELHRTEIETEAYLLWESRGYTHGQEHEDWLRAVELVRARHQ